MNDSNTQRSEKIAAKILRTLAIIGLVAVLALASWVLVRGTQSVPVVRDGMSAAVSAVQGIFQTASEESLTFELEERTIAVGEKTTFAWNYLGDSTPETYSFSYSCGSPVELTIIDNNGWTDFACDTEYMTTDTNISVSATNDQSRFADFEVSVSTGDLTDTTAITIVNTDITIDEILSASDNEEDDTSDSEQTEDTTEVVAAPVTPTPVTPVVTTPTQGRSTQTVVRRTTPVYSGPADLVLNIKETGIILDVDGEDTFFPVDERPTDNVAGIVFTVTNRGGETSEIWTFDAYLPIEGDDEYEYNSPKQIPLASGMEIEFTLGFDELLEEDEGKITIELDANDRNDKTSNNEDSVIIDIDVE